MGFPVRPEGGLPRLESKIRGAAPGKKMNTDQSGNFVSRREAFRLLGLAFGQTALAESKIQTRHRRREFSQKPTR